jgi:hypothetical protein
MSDPVSFVGIHAPWNWIFLTGLAVMIPSLPSACSTVGRGQQPGTVSRIARTVRSPGLVLAMVGADAHHAASPVLPGVVPLIPARHLICPTSFSGGVSATCSVRDIPWLPCLPSPRPSKVSIIKKNQNVQTSYKRDV